MHYDLKDVCLKMRQDCLVMAEAAGSSGMHFGGTLSMIEIIAVLYLQVMKITPDYLNDEKRDRAIISKGHGIPAVYAVLHQAGIITDDELKTFKQNETELYGHPSKNKRLCIEFSSGSLGQGLSLGVGTAIALLRKNNNNSRVFVILGDGECDEGSVWEAAMSAAKFNLNNLVAVIDKNKIQYDGDTEEIMPLLSLSDKWKSFGWNTLSIDGHNIIECEQALSTRYSKPTVIIANTVKGKGISFMENNPEWHHRQMTKTQAAQAWQELNGEDQNGI